MKLLLHSNISLLILLAFTLKEPEPFRVRLNIQRQKDLTIIDSTSLCEKLKFYRRYDSVADYPIFYLGDNINTLSLTRTGIPYTRSAEPRDYSKLRNWEHVYLENELNITVDRSFKLAFQDTYGHSIKNYQDYRIDSICYYHAYPIFVTNHSDSLIQVGFANALRVMVLQLQNQYGQWIDVERPAEIFCGLGLRIVVLEPGQIVVAKYIRHSGKNKALCRLKFTHFSNIVYSNSFVDWVDDRMLKKANGQ